MRFKVQRVVCTEDVQEDAVHEMMVLDKACQRIEHLGLTLAEAKQSLAALQECLVDQQTWAFVAAHAQCEHWGTALRIKGYHPRTFRTLFGTVTPSSLRRYRYRGQRRKTTTFQPLNALPTDAVAPERLLMERKWPSWVSYGLIPRSLMRS